MQPLNVSAISSHFPPRVSSLLVYQIRLYISLLKSYHIVSANVRFLPNHAVIQVQLYETRKCNDK